MNIFYIGLEPISERFVKNYFLRDLVEANYRITYLYLNYSKIKVPSKAKLKKINQLEIHSNNDLSLFVKNNNLSSNFIVILFLPYGNFEKNIYTLFCGSKMKLIYFDWGSYPISISYKNNRILLFILNNFIVCLLRTLYRKLIIRNSFPIDTLFFSGHSPRTLHFFSPIHKLNIDFFDVVSFNNIKNKVYESKRQYAVFLDVNIINHPDFDLLSIKKIDAVNYYKNINDFFSYIEDKYDVDIVIAAHPTLEVSEFNKYNGRRVVKSKTAELVTYSKFVISHHSTAISFALLAFKPIIFIYNNDIANQLTKNVFRLILGLSYQLNQPFINISVSKEFDNFSLTYNEDFYKKFLYKYIYTGKPFSQPSNTFLSHFKYY